MQPPTRRVVADRQRAVHSPPRTPTRYRTPRTARNRRTPRCHTSGTPVAAYSRQSGRKLRENPHMTDRRAVLLGTAQTRAWAECSSMTTVRFASLPSIAPARRNAVDSVAAAALLEAFVDFDADESLSIAVLTGAGGYFCAGADLHALADGDRRPVTDDGPGPMGPTRLPWQAGDRGHRGTGCRRWTGAGAVVRPPGGRVRRRPWRVLPPLRRAARRSRDDQPAPPDRPQQGDGSVAHRSGLDGAEAERIGLVNRVTAPGEALTVAVAAGPGACRPAAAVHAQ